LGRELLYEESRDMKFDRVSPQVDFPRLEEEVLGLWKRTGAFEKSVMSRPEDRPFVFYEGPPTANGRPGFHHALARAFKDLIPRYKTMQGYRVERKGGWDCHGLPVEIQVEKELGLEGKADVERYGVEEFNRLCRESVFRYVEDWQKMSERLGFWVDMDHPYRTLDGSYIESVWWDGSLNKALAVPPYLPGTSRSGPLRGVAVSRNALAVTGSPVRSY
jgi:isoleucyl-tRNA synthetase